MKVLLKMAKKKEKNNKDKLVKDENSYKKNNLLLDLIKEKKKDIKYCNETSEYLPTQQGCSSDIREARSNYNLRQHKQIDYCEPELASSCFHRHFTGVSCLQ